MDHRRAPIGFDQARNHQSDYGSDVDLPSPATKALSDYGSDIDWTHVDEDVLLGDVLIALAASAPTKDLQPNIESDAQRDGFAPLRERAWQMQSSPAAGTTAMEIEYDAPSRRAFSVPLHEQQYAADATADINALRDNALPADDDRPPIERFRTKPRKPLSVTDIVAPSWCEIQFFYNLTRFGKTPRTKAMKKGSKIHQTLENEVYTFVPVQVQTKEDRFGLRIWNAIQGLRCLRETGLTRELEVWGIVEGQVVNGVIDELSFTCPDPDMEEKLELAKVRESGGTLPLGQLSIEQAFQASGGGGASVVGAEDNGTSLSASKADRQVYVADVKTRGVRSLPSGASLRGTRMQLMLYRKLLESLSLNTVDAESVLSRYSLELLEPFSEDFILSGGIVGTEDLNSDAENPFIVLQSNELRSHPNLLSLWSLMISEYQETIPTISHILRAEFRYAQTGEVLGNELMVYSADTIDAYVKDEIDWWRGAREARGVDIEEAFKCRMCDFADECSWRKTKIDEATEKNRLRRMREKSAV